MVRNNEGNKIIFLNTYTFFMIKYEIHVECIEKTMQESTTNKCK